MTPHLSRVVSPPLDDADGVREKGQNLLAVVRRSVRMVHPLYQSLLVFAALLHQDDKRGSRQAPGSRGSQPISVVCDTAVRQVGSRDDEPRAERQRFRLPVVSRLPPDGVEPERSEQRK